jgi:hypothetical protein
MVGKVGHGKRQKAACAPRGNITLDELREIVAKAGGPPIEDTFNARCIVDRVNSLIGNKAHTPIKLSRDLVACRKALGELAQNLPTIIASYEKSEADYRDRLESRVRADLDQRLARENLRREDAVPESYEAAVQEEVRFRTPEWLSAEPSAETSYRRVRRLLQAIDDVWPAIAFKIPTAGRGPSAVPYSALENIYQRLIWAWGEAGQPVENLKVKVSQSRALKVVVAIAARADVYLQADSLRKMIDVKPPQFLPRDHPQRQAHWRAAAEMRAIGDEIRLREDAPGGE